MSTTDAFGSFIDGEFVTIYVGPKRMDFVVHKKLICKSADFFEKAFNSNFLEANEVCTSSDFFITYAATTYVYACPIDNACGECILTYQTGYHVSRRGQP